MSLPASRFSLYIDKAHRIAFAFDFAFAFGIGLLLLVLVLPLVLWHWIVVANVGT